MCELQSGMKIGDKGTEINAYFTRELQSCMVTGLIFFSMRQVAALANLRFSLLTLLSAKKLADFFVQQTACKRIRISGISGNNRSFDKRKTYLFRKIFLFQNIPNERVLKEVLRKWRRLGEIGNFLILAVIYSTAKFIPDRN